MQDQKIIGAITFTSGLRAGKTVPRMWGDMSEADRKAMAERAGAASAAPAGKAGRDDTPRWAATIRGQRQWRTAP